MCLGCCLSPLTFIILMDTISRHSHGLDDLSVSACLQIIRLWTEVWFDCEAVETIIRVWAHGGRACSGLGSISGVCSQVKGNWLHMLLCLGEERAERESEAVTFSLRPHTQRWPRALADESLLFHRRKLSWAHTVRRVIQLLLKVNDWLAGVRRS